MSYMHIPNLYKDDSVLLLKTVYALEKIHGTSAHIAWKDGTLRFFAGGCAHEAFVALFDQAALTKALAAMGGDEITVYGEAYGGKIQGMRGTYGPALRFVAFEVKIGECWLAVPDAAQVVCGLGLEFVHFALVPAELSALDAQRDADSEQAKRNGMGPGLKREGIVIRPPSELRKNNGERLIAKHKRPEFGETATPRMTGEAMQRLAGAKAVATEWVTPMRLTHVLDSLGNPCEIERTGDVCRAMLADVEREGAGEIEWATDVRRAVGARAAQLYKVRILGRG